MCKHEQNEPESPKSRNTENVHIKRMDRAIASMRRIATQHLGGECERELREHADELEETRGVILLIFDKIDEC